MTTIDDLSDDVVGVIKEYLPPTTLVWLNATYYDKYKHLIKHLIPEDRFEDYIRDTVRRDNSFVLEHIVRENIERWVKLKRWRYKNMVFSDYLHFIYNYSIETESHKSRKLIDTIATELFGKKWHKKNGIRYIRTKWMS